ncbi:MULTISPECIES: Rne/Rng family ribonuclease [unclassified Psychrobacter]|uniref:Rne/Rng family ribonuclease n=1 Tax=unclassified Psychrobacter TaxID=196806 RepID=UPI0018F74D3C|nr:MULTISPECIES: Rne/Rng family ribonuclease [unclassified Psychrobacter]
MKRILINATQNEEIRVALCKGNHLYDFDLENRTREQKKSNIYKGHVTRVEPSLEAVFVEYGSQRQGFLPIREISAEYLSGNPRDENIKKLIKEGDELIVQVEKEERGNKGAALSTYVSLAGRYLVLMPNNPRGGGISRQISGKLREDMKRMLGNLDLPKGMSVIIRTAGIGKTQEDLQHDLNHLLNIWQAIQEQNKKYPSPRLVHQEAGVVTRAVRDYLRDDITEIWIDNENAYVEAANFIDAVMPKQADKLRKYTDYEPMFARFNIEKQIETAYQREVRLPSGGSIVIDQTEALVSIDINSAKSTKGSDVAETAYHTNLEAADEIARQLRLRDMGGLIVIDFIDMNDNKHQKEVEKRLVEATKYDRARVQFGEISKFGLMEMSRQRLRPSLEESTGYICPRCHGNGMIRDLRSLSLSIMRQIEQIALKERQGEVQAEVPTDIAAFLLNEKRDSLVYLEQDSGTRITILPHAHLESPNFKLHFNRDGFAPSSYERITDTQQQEHSDLGYDVDWQTADKERPEHQPQRQPRKSASKEQQNSNNSNNKNEQQRSQQKVAPAKAEKPSAPVTQAQPAAPQPQAVAWLSNLFAKAPEARVSNPVSSNDAAEAIETLVNTGAESLGAFGQVDNSALARSEQPNQKNESRKPANNANNTSSDDDSDSQEQKEHKGEERRKRKSRKSRSGKARPRRSDSRDDAQEQKSDSDNKGNEQQDKSSGNERRDNRSDKNDAKDNSEQDEQTRAKRKPNSQRSSRGKLERGEALSTPVQDAAKDSDDTTTKAPQKRRHQNPDDVALQVTEAPTQLKEKEVVHLSLDDSKDSDKRRHSAKDKAAHSDKASEQSASQTKSEAPKAADSQSDKVSSEAKAAPKADTEANKADKPADSAKKPASAEPKETPEAKQPQQPATGQPADAAQAQPVEKPQDDTAPASADKSLSFSHEMLFGTRYVTAHKFGQAKNDPRVVRQQQAPAKAAEQSAPSIAGSVGEFISATLPDAQTRLNSDGVIRSFIDAVMMHQAQGSQTLTQHFDFSNYGYQPLAADYLTQFTAMTSAVSQFATSAGKTAVETRAIGKRASNDPRGQHPDYLSDAEPVSSDATDDSEPATQAGDTAEQPAVQAPLETHEANALTAEAQAEHVSQDSEALLEAEPVQAAEDDAKDDSANKAKTTIASYKNMIENVAEQLLPQTGMFNLTTPKVPKARSRKPKTEHKKPTQAEKTANKGDKE